MHKIFVVLITLFASLSAATWPKIDITNKEQCTKEIAEKILSMANAAFNSPMENVQSFPKNLLSKDEEILILFQGTESNLTIDETFFEKIHKRYSPTYYWQRDSVINKRLVIMDATLSSRSVYRVYSIDETMSKEEFDSAINAQSIKPIIETHICAPIIFQQISSKEIWAINIGKPYKLLNNWEIYATGSKEKTPCCLVSFSSNSEPAKNALPQQVQVLANLLDDTLGDGREDGSMQQTGHLRAGTNITWGNVALRPWAVNNAYNSREEINSGLLVWSRTGKKYLALYKKIQAQYPIAEKALAKYYKEIFTLTQEKAENLAKYTLDIGYRNNFIFPKTSENGESIANPWNE